MKLVIFLVCTLLAGQVMAAPATQLNDGGYPWLTDKNYEKAKKEAQKKGRRKIASSHDISDDMMSNDLKSFRGIVIGEKNSVVKGKFLASYEKSGKTPCSNYEGIKTKEEVHNCLNYLDENYDSFADDLKFVAAMLIPLRAFRSFAYKLYPLVKREKVTHSVVLSRVFAFASFMNVNLPEMAWDAGFRYATEPFSADEERFNHAEELQYHVAIAIYPELAKAAKRIAELDFSGKKIVWDNQLLYGSASFTDDFKRYRYLGEAERAAALSNLHAGLAWISRFNSYNVKGSMALMKEIGMLYGIDALWGSVEGVTAKKIHEVISKGKFAGLFTLRQFGQVSMDKAFMHMKESARYRVIAWNEFKDRPASEDDVFNSVGVDAIRNRTDRGAKKVEDIMTGETEIRSDITGEVIKVNLPKFYARAPADLKDLIPTGFNDKEKDWVKTRLKDKNGKLKNVKYRNYFYGRATNWNLAAYRNLFPAIKNDTDVATYARILNQSTGGLPVAVMLNQTMLYNR